MYGSARDAMCNMDLMCGARTKNGERCHHKAETFCWQHQPAEVQDTNGEALEVLIAGRDDVPPHLAVLATMLADELDRQVAVGEGLNAALVGRYVEALGVLTVDDDDGADPIGDLLAKILNESPTGATQQG